MKKVKQEEAKEFYLKHSDVDPVSLLLHFSNQKIEERTKELESANKDMRRLLKAVEVDSRGIGSGVNNQLYDKILEAIKKYQ